MTRNRSTIWRIKHTDVAAIAMAATGARALMANAMAEAVDDNNATVSMKKKNFPASCSSPNEQTRKTMYNVCSHE